MGVCLSRLSRLLSLLFLVQRKSSFGFARNRLNSLAESGALKAVKRLFAKKPKVVKTGKGEGGDGGGRKHTATHTLSVFLGTVSKLADVRRGTKLRLTMIVLGSKAKMDFEYDPGGACGCVDVGVVVVVVYNGGACVRVQCRCVPLRSSCVRHPPRSRSST